MSSCILMVPPHGFQFNSQTAVSNSFQTSTAITDLTNKAMIEYQAMVAVLQNHGITILTLNQDECLPDAVFPNNWFSTHIDDQGNNVVIIYPMLTENRQAEVNIAGLTSLLEKQSIHIDKLIDLRTDQNNILEGTGSLVLDKEYKTLYASVSPRTSESLVHQVAQLLNYKTVLFNSVNDHHDAIYHTNVMMSIARHYAIVCLESIPDQRQRENVLVSLQNAQKQVIAITLDQMNHMCGNVLELFNQQDESILVMSAQAHQYFSKEQLNQIQQFSPPVPVAIETIETVGGGSARCMMAEILLE